MPTIILRNLHLQSTPPGSLSNPLRLAIVAGAALACTLFAGSIYAAAAAKPSPQTPQREQLTIKPEER